MVKHHDALSSLLSIPADANKFIVNERNSSWLIST